jgi:DNA-binding transcriptional ArsR family regulator
MVMYRREGRFRSEKLKESFLLIEKKSLLYTQVFKGLHGSALKIYLLLRAKTYGALSRGAYEEDITLPYSILVEDSGVSIGTVRKALVELENKGLIDLKKQGGLKSGGKSSNIYRLSMRFEKYGEDDFQPGTMKILKGKMNHCGFAVVQSRKQSVPIKTRARLLYKVKRKKTL